MRYTSKQYGVLPAENRGAGLQVVKVAASCRGQVRSSRINFNPLNPELSPICYLLALLGAHHFLHVSRIRVKLLTFRLLMSYIYIWSTHS